MQYRDRMTKRRRRTIVSGARTRGHAEFGWGDDKSPKAGTGSNVVGRPVS